MAKSSAKKPINELSILDKEKSKAQSKEQKRFDSLTKRIKDLEIKLEKDQQKLDAALHQYITNVHPLNLKLVNKKSEFVFKVDEISQKHKLSKKQQEIVADLINDEFYDILECVDLTEAQEKLYDKWSDQSYKDELEEQKEYEKSMLEFSIKMAFNGEIEMSDFEDTPEGRARLQARIEAYKEEKLNEYKNTQQTKKPSKKELLQKQAEELKQKNIRSIYISLVKVLHPDTEQDEQLKIQKNELMKKVTVAYDNKDISTLLRLEAEWIHQTNDRLESVSESTLKLYNESLYQRLEELEYKKFVLYKNPAYENIEDYMHLSENRIYKELDKDVIQINTDIDYLDDAIKLVEEELTKKEFIDFLVEYLDGDVDNDKMHAQFIERNLRNM